MEKLRLNNHKGELYMKKNKTLKRNSTSFNNEIGELDFETYCSLVDEGYRDKDIASEYHVNDEYLKQLREDSNE
jgi:hypothetical protein